MFDWDKFKNGEIAVHCDTEEKANNFLNECERKNISWCTCRDATSDNNWRIHKENTSYCCYSDNAQLGYTTTQWYASRGKKIIKWEIDNMKELTFKEVIANIKEGEVWNCEGYKVRNLRNGDIQFVIPNGSIIGFQPEDRFNLERKKYTFEEAFKALEKGKEIESVIINRKYKLIDNMVRILNNKSRWIKYYGFDYKAIKGKWYIND